MQVTLEWLDTFTDIQPTALNSKNMTSIDTADNHKETSCSACDNLFVVMLKTVYTIYIKTQRSSMRYLQPNTLSRKCRRIFLI